MATVKMNLNGNSHKSKKEKLTCVTKGKVSNEVREKGFWETFFEDDFKDIWSFIKDDVLKPALKNLIYDVGAGSLERALFGTSSRGRRSGGRNETIDYSGRYKYGHNRNSRVSDPRDDYSDDPSSVKFDFREDAEEVKKALVQQITRYGKATVGDFYDAAGVTPSDNFSRNEEYGWTDLNTCQVRLARGGGYYLDLPRERYING